MRTKGEGVHAMNLSSAGKDSHVAAEYSLWGVDVQRSRTQITSNEDKEIRRGGATDGERENNERGEAGESTSEGWRQT